MNGYSATTPVPVRTAPVTLATYAQALAHKIPLGLIQLAGRIGLGSLFWKSGQAKLATWEVTLQLFEYEYNLPLLPPEIAANLATAAEVSGACLLVAGLATRLSALMLLGVVATIQIFVFPGNWGEHSLWAALLLLLVARGAGPVSLDHLLARFVFTRR